MTRGRNDKTANARGLRRDLPMGFCSAPLLGRTGKGRAPASLLSSSGRETHRQAVSTASCGHACSNAAAAGHAGLAQRNVAGGRRRRAHAGWAWRKDVRSLDDNCKALMTCRNHVLDTSGSGKRVTKIHFFRSVSLNFFILKVTIRKFKMRVTFCF